MTRRNKRSWARNPAILLVAFATMLALSGLVYTHWFANLEIHGQIDTGNVNIAWGQVGTDDDGQSDNDQSGTDDGGGTDLDMNEEGSSDDPSSPFGATRELKDVASCHANPEGDQGEQLGVYTQNAYPGYHCTVEAEATNWGSIPVKATAFTMTAEKAYDFAWESSPGNQWFGNVVEEPEGSGLHFAALGCDGFGLAGDPDEAYNETPCFDETGFLGTLGAPVTSTSTVEGLTVVLDPTHPGAFGLYNPLSDTTDVTGDISGGVYCGTQLDPNEDPPVSVDGWTRVEQSAMQNASYSYWITQEFVNWNEWDASLCTEGTIVADADGTPIGIANGTTTPTPFPAG